MSCTRLVVLLSVLGTLTAPSWAAETSKTIGFDGSQPNQKVELSDVESHTLYRYDEVPDTCYRTVSDGFSTECHTEYRQECQTVWKDECTGGGQECSTVYRDECHTGPGRCERVQGPDGRWRDECSPGETVCERVPSTECHSSSPTCTRVPDQECTSIPEERCEQVEHHHEEAYACTKTVAIPIGEEKDFDVSAHVAVNFGKVSAGVAPAEKVSLSLEAEKVSIAKAGLSGRLLLFVKSQQAVSETRPDQGPNSPGLKEVNATFDINLVDPKAMLGGVTGGVKDIAIRGSVLTFTLGKVGMPEVLALSLDLERDKIFANKKLYSGRLSKDAYSLKDVAGSDRTQVAIALDRLGLPEAIKKGSNYILNLTASLDKTATPDGTLLNPENLPSGQAQALKQKIKAN